MKRFLKWFVVLYILFAFLHFCLFWFVPDQFPGDPAPRGLAAFFAWIGPALATVLICTSFPSLFLSDALAPLFPSFGKGLVLLLTLSVSAALWACLVLWLTTIMNEGSGARQGWTTFNRAANPTIHP